MLAEADDRLSGDNGWMATSAASDTVAKNVKAEWLWDLQQARCYAAAVVCPGGVLSSYGQSAWCVLPCLSCLWLGLVPTASGECDGSVSSEIQMTGRTAHRPPTRWLGARDVRAQCTTGAGERAAE